MLIGEPQESQYDWRFSVFGFSTRVTWLFWAMTAALGYNSAVMIRAEAVRNGFSTPLVLILGIWVAVAFVSILLHELGHAIAYRYFGVQCQIVLYQLGGLAIPGAGMLWGNQGRRHRLSHVDHIIVSVAGPGIQLTFGAIVGITAIFCGVDIYEFRWIAHYFQMPTSRPVNPLVFQSIHSIVYINIWWALLNLLPIYPLDGGQIAQRVFGITRRSDGMYEAYALGAITGLLVAIWMWQSSRSGINALFFAALALNNFQSLQSSHGPRKW